MRSFCARKPNTKRSESITFDLPLPFGPITALKLWNNGVRVSGEIWEGLGTYCVEGAEDVLAVVGLEVLDFDVVYH